MEIVIPLNPDFSKAQTGSVELCAVEKEDKCPLGTSQLEKLKNKQTQQLPAAHWPDFHSKVFKSI